MKLCILNKIANKLSILIDISICLFISFTFINKIELLSIFALVSRIDEELITRLNGYEYVAYIFNNIKLNKETIQLTVRLTFAISHRINSAIPQKNVQNSRLSRGKLKMQPAVWLWRNGAAAGDIWTYSILIVFQKKGHRIMYL